MCGLTSSFCQEEKKQTLSTNSCYWTVFAKSFAQCVALFTVQQHKVRFYPVPLSCHFKILSTRWCCQALAIEWTHRHVIVSGHPNGTGRKTLTSSTSFSRKGTSLRSSLSFLSTNQLSMGIPLESWRRSNDITRWQKYKLKFHLCFLLLLLVEKIKWETKLWNYLIGKGLWWIVNYYGLGKIPAENVEVFNIIPLDADTVLPK